MIFALGSYSVQRLLQYEKTIYRALLVRESFLYVLIIL